MFLRVARFCDYNLMTIVLLHPETTEFETVKFAGMSRSKTQCYARSSPAGCTALCRHKNQNSKLRHCSINFIISAVFPFL